MRIEPVSRYRRSTPALLLLLAGALAGCPKSVGPIEDPDFEETVRASVDLEGAPILAFSRAFWMPGADQIVAGAVTAERAEDGVVVLLDERLLFLGWRPDSRSYEVLREIVYADARDVRLRVWGVNRHIVLETEVGRFDSFQLTSNNGMGVSIPRAENALGLLRERIPSSDAP